jgi:tRNA-dihydrouridine synthase
MEDVTDAAFRAHIAAYSARDIPRVFYTEFTSADGLMRAEEAGRSKLLKKLEFSDAERPMVAQLFTSSPAHMEAGARLCRELGFDGFDINMGCPDRAVERQGCGSALIRTPELARELIRAAKRGAGDMPVSVKTRLGYSADELETWLPVLLSEEPAVVTLHARTRKELSDVPARWERIARAVEIRDALTSRTLIVGNGDVRDLADARAKAAQTGCDGVMLGRAIFGNPWLFTDRAGQPSKEEKLRGLIEHITRFEQKLSGFQNDAVMKRHFKAYIGGWDGAKELRAQLMEADTLAAARALLHTALSS